ncbi:MAG: DUF4097 family beta strand repeat protein, partial [Candidatus Aminicenantes bacterium]|nr:DUF4097 family beta strand repeat protein [Candidatus Aminicenantes bacterium]
KPGGTLKIDTQRGSIEVVAETSNTVEIEIIREVKTSSKEEAQKVLAKFPIEFDQRGNNIFITAESEERGLSKIWNDLFKKLRIKYIISVPTRYNVNLDTSGGSISVDGLEGRAVTKTSGGSLHFENIEGDIDGKTSGGSITIEHAQGDVDVHTSGGGITVHEVMGTIKAHTSGGSIKAYISEQPRADCSLTTSGGSITVYMAEDTSVDVIAKTSGGSVSTDFPVTLRGEIKRDRLEAKINDGGPQLNLETSGGSIRIKQK